METTTQDLQTKSGLGGKIAIAIIVIVLIFGALYFFVQRKNRIDQEIKNIQETNSKNLSSELDTMVNIDIDSDLDNVDKTLSN